MTREQRTILQYETIQFGHVFMTPIVYDSEKKY